MALFFVTGPVGVGKRAFADNAVKIMDRLGRKVLVSSIADARGMYTRELNVPLGSRVRETLLDAMRVGLMDTLAVSTVLSASKSKPDDIVITMPLAVMNQHGAVSDQVSVGQMERLVSLIIEVTGQSVAHFTCLIDDPRIIIDGLKEGDEGRAYARSVTQLLEWTSMEVLLTQMLAERFSAGWCVLPAPYSRASLAKIIYDVSQKREPHITYVAHPISELLAMKSGSGYEKYTSDERAELVRFAEACENDIKNFKRRLQASTIVISPIELAKMNTDVEGDSLFGMVLEKAKAGGLGAISDNQKIEGIIRSALASTIFEALREHTIYRDLYWFVRKVSRVVAFFPAKVNSPGADSEVQEALALGRRVLLVKDSRKIPAAREQEDKDSAKADSPFYIEKALDKSDIFSSSDRFISKETPEGQSSRYQEVESAYDDIKKQKQ
ncbi:hypothetical protein HYT84_01930 [Candidatus Micrarchaeota archaeon]|nr:hypothetical protein [Candidatus Micrarchaeota archaeon]